MCYAIAQEITIDFQSLQLLRSKILSFHLKRNFKNRKMLLTYFQWHVFFFPSSNDGVKNFLFRNILKLLFFYFLKIIFDISTSKQS